MTSLRHLRSDTANKRPDPTALSSGQIAINYEAGSPGLFFKDTDGNLVKAGPVHVGTSAPNATPAAGGSTGNAKGEFWLDTTGGAYDLKIWSGAAWVSTSGEYVNITGDTMTGNLTLDNCNLVFEGSTADSFETTLTVVDPTADNTITLPNVSGTVVTTGDTGTVTSTMIANATIVDADISASAEIAVSKLADGAARQLLQTDAAGTGVEWTSNVDIPGTLDVTGAAVFDSTANIAGNLTVDTNTLFVDAANNRVGIGTSTPRALLDVGGSSVFNAGTYQSPALAVSNGYIAIKSNAADGASRLTLIGDSATGDGTIDWGGTGNFNLKFTNNGSERARIDSSGRLLVGTSTSRSNWYNTTGLDDNLQIEGTTHGGSGFSIVRSNNLGGHIELGGHGGTTIGSYTLVSSTASLGSISFQGADGAEFVEAASIAALVDGTPGANDMPGRLVFSTTADGASSPTERMRITSNGNLLVGTTITSGYRAEFIQSLATTVNVTRTGNDGSLIDFIQDTTIEGTISVSGTTVSYNGAHLSRWSQIPGIDPHDKNQRPEILRGTVMSNLDEMCDWIDPESGDAQDNEQLNKTKISDVEGDKNVAGVFQSWDDDDDTWVNDYYLSMTGDFIIRIAAGVTVERGDLLMSAGDGTAKPQADDVVRSCTIAKVTSTTVSCTHPDGSYCVPCVLMAC